MIRYDDLFGVSAVTFLSLVMKIKSLYTLEESLKPPSLGEPASQGGDDREAVDDKITKDDYYPDPRDSADPTKEEWVTIDHRYVEYYNTNIMATKSGS